jgi:hypothetical protein
LLLALSSLSVKVDLRSSTKATHPVAELAVVEVERTGVRSVWIHLYHSLVAAVAVIAAQTRLAPVIRVNDQ